VFKQFKAWAENLTGERMGSLRDDKGGEYMSREFEAFCIDHGIQRQHTVRNRPQQNGIAERANRTIEEGIIFMLYKSGMPPSFWGEAMASFIHVSNRVTSSSLQGATSYEAFYGSKPDLSHLHVWGCTAYILIQKDKQPLGSLGAHMEKCIFIEYPQGYKGWKFYNPLTKQVLISECADFNVHFFMYQKHSAPQLQPTRPESLLESPTPPVHLPTTLDSVLDDCDDLELSQQPVHGEGGSTVSDQSSVHHEMPPSTYLLLPPPSASPPALASPPSTPLIAPAPPTPPARPHSVH